MRLLWSLGDFAFRELTIYLALIDTDRVPAAICVYFNVSNVIGIILFGSLFVIP